MKQSETNDKMPAHNKRNRCTTRLREAATTLCDTLWKRQHEI